MNNLRLYKVEDKYINYLKGCDKKVQHNKNKRRPYVGVVLIIGSYKYFVPMESPKENHDNIKAGIHILKLDNGRLGLLGFNNMIPVPDSAIIAFDINKETDKQYKELLKHQIAFINSRKADIYEHASKTYFKATKGNNRFLSNICCDFKKLENACKRYNPNYSSKSKSIKSATLY